MREEKEHREVDPREPPGFAHPPALAPVARAALAPVAGWKKLTPIAGRKKLVAGWIRSPAAARWIWRGDLGEEEV